MKSKKLVILLCAVLFVVACSGEDEPVTDGDDAGDHDVHNDDTDGDIDDEEDTGPTCTGDEIICDGECVDTTTDSDFCGDCDTQCEGDLECGDSLCTCPDDLDACGGSCVDFEHDPGFCGDCDTQCEADQLCSQGGCVDECPTGFTACNSTCVESDGICDVNVIDGAYRPNELTVEAGTTVVWTQEGVGSHTVTSGVDGDEDEIFDSGLMGPGDSFEFTFDSAGDFPYFCIPHYLAGMEGMVSVE